MPMDFVQYTNVYVICLRIFTSKKKYNIKINKGLPSF